MYDLGILGGMGSKATATLFEIIVDNTDATRDQEHLDTVIFNRASLPDRTGSILSGEKEELISQLKETIEQINSVGVKKIAIPCNTSHFLYEDMQAAANAEIINMVKSALQYVALSKLPNEICVLGTLGTVESGIYERFNEFGLNITYPDSDLCQEVQRIIYEIKNTKDGSLEHLSVDFKNVIRAADTNSKQKKTYIIACTELSLLNKSILSEFSIVDALEILALLCVESSDKKIAYGRLCYDYEVIKNMA